MNEMYIKWFLIGFGSVIGLGIVVGLLFFLIKNGIANILNFTIEKIKNFLDFIITEILKLFVFICGKSVEMITLINGFNAYRHPPTNSIDYASFCILTVCTTYILVNKGNVSVKDFTSILDKFKNNNNEKI